MAAGRTQQAVVLLTCAASFCITYYLLEHLSGLSDAKARVQQWTTYHNQHTHAQDIHAQRTESAAGIAAAVAASMASSQVANAANDVGGSTDTLTVVSSTHSQSNPEPAKKDALLDQLDSSCHTEENAEYWGEFVVEWGSGNIKQTASECCEACRQTNTADRVPHKRCNVWVWCAGAEGCGSNKFGECWLKHANVLEPMAPQVHGRGPGVHWSSGVVVTAAQVEASRARVAAFESEHDARLHRPGAPRVYLDVSIKGQPIGRMEFVLFTQESPLAAENFRALCTGEKGIAPPGTEGEGKPYHFKGARFYRIIDRFIDQTGAPTGSIYGKAFDDDPGGLKLKHDRPGLLSMANIGPNTNGAHFSIVVAPAPHLDGHYTIFGELVSGMDVAYKINALAKGKPQNTAGIEEDAWITDSGQLA
eukprot:jgi/Mesvir1/16153/Mv08424-RA.1